MSTHTPGLPERLTVSHQGSDGHYSLLHADGCGRLRGKAEAEEIARRYNLHPDMLEALRLIGRGCACPNRFLGVGCGCARETARAAIKKAEGGE